MKYLYSLFAFLPVAVAAELMDLGSSLVFLTSAAVLVPAAALIGQATDELAERSGPKLGALLNVTMGNAAELVIGVIALRHGLTDLVKASLAGSILTNLLLVLGASALVGGLKHGTQQFDRNIAGISATMLTLAVIALSLEGLFITGSHAVTGESDRESLSVGISLILLALYALYVTYTIVLLPRSGGSSGKGGRSGEGQNQQSSGWSPPMAIGALVVATVVAVVASELLVDSVEPAIRSWGLTELFIGIVVIPIVGNAAEHWSAIAAASRNEMDLTLGISIGSSLQIALLAAPLLVLFGLATGDRLHLTFNQYELAALLGGVAIATFIAFDGTSNWVEGAQLCAVYALFALGFFYLS